MNQKPPEKSGAPKVLKLFVVGLIATLAVIIFFILYWCFIPPKIVADADAGFRRAKQSVNPEQLRQWALEAIKHLPATNGSQTLPESEIPQYIRNLYSHPPESVSVMRDEVAIIWGGGFFHWGIQIGSTNFVRLVGESSDQQTVEWVPGIYYSHEGNRKIQ